MNRRCLTLSFAALVAFAQPGVTRGDGANVVRAVSARADGGRTVITIRGSATPSFTAYRLERPTRLVVDLAGGRLEGVDGPIEVDTWAVGQVSAPPWSDSVPA